MIRRVGAALALLLALGCAPRPEAPPPTLILGNVTVIDGRGGPPVPGRSIEIAAGRIVRIRPARRDESSNPASGRFVIPGLIDSHVHLGQDAATLGVILDSLLRRGITSVREMACCADLYRPLGSEADSTRMPRVFYSAFWADSSFFTDDPRVNSVPGSGKLPWLLGVGRGTNLDSAVRAARSNGVTGIKIYSNLDSAIVAQIVAAAHAQGLRVWSHTVIFPTRPSAVVATGVDVVSHAALLVWEGADRLPRRYDAEPFNPFGPKAPYETVAADSPPVRRVLDAMKARGVILDPTISTMRGAVSEAAYQWAVRVTRLAHELGIPLAPGTDREHFVAGEPALYAELATLVRDVGLTPLEAITAATWNAAAAVGARDRIGSIEEGKVADLVVLRSDPSRDVSRLTDIAQVIKGGRPVTPGHP